LTAIPSIRLDFAMLAPNQLLANSPLQPCRIGKDQSTVLAPWHALTSKIVPSPANKIISLPAGTEVAARHCETIDHDFLKEAFMGRGILLWLLGIPIPIIILIMLFVR
jgi:hypothetical protein